MSNWVDFFRFNNRYEDVFIEDDHYLYARAEPYNWAYMLACNQYDTITDHKGEYIRHDCVGASADYLQTLIPAPIEVAREIIRIETINYLHWWNDANDYTPDDEEYMEPEDWADYLTDTMTCEEC